jgi:hypothetical protein
MGFDVNVACHSRFQLRTEEVPRVGRRRPIPLDPARVVQNRQDNGTDELNTLGFVGPDDVIKLRPSLFS